MTVFEQLQSASFKRFTFLVESETASAGKKVIAHEYPNSDKRFAEELGARPYTFTIPAIVHGDVNLRRRFEQLLNEPGIGTLVHPVYGTLNVMAGAYTVASNQTRIGEFRFNLTFYATDDNVTPSVDLPSNSQVTDKVDDVSKATGDALENQYIDPTFVDSFNAAKDKVDAFFAAAQAEAAKIKNPITQNLSSFNSLLNSFRSGVSGIIQSASNVREALESTFLELSNIANLPADLADAWDALIVFGSDDELIENTTVKRDEIINNRNTINDYIKIQSLARSYEASVYTEFQTDIELIAEREEQEENFIEITLAGITPDSIAESALIVLQPNVRDNIFTLRSIYNDVSAQLLQNTWRVVELTPGRTSIFLMSYRYYGNDDNVSLLQTLNPQMNHALLNTEAKGVTT